jgi:hypothetical protein
MRHESNVGIRHRAGLWLRQRPLLLTVGLISVLGTKAVSAQEVGLPAYLRDRGTGVASSMFGTYVREGELLVYPFFEWYHDSNYEYKPSELGFAPPGDPGEFRGRYRASEGLLFLGYGLSRNLAIELEAAVITAELRKSSRDTSAMPSAFKESGLGDVEAQVRWRFREESARRHELFTYFELVFPFQKNRQLIGTSTWEYKLGIGAVRGHRWGTMTYRLEAEYAYEEDENSWKFEAGEYAIEYLRRFSPNWRFFAAIEGVQIDEVELITEMQWHFHPRAYLKLNNGLGITPNATDIAPEIGIMFRFGGPRTTLPPWRP